MPYNANPRMPKTCDGCIYQSDLGGSYKVCIYIIETGQKRPCPPENCTVYQSDKLVFSNRLPDDVISEMRRLRKAGMQIKDIAGKLGYSEQSVSKYVKCVDVKIDRSRISREQRDDIIRRKKEGQTILQIAKETGISHTTVNKLTKGIQAVNKFKEEDPMPKAISQDKIDEIRAMREQGISVEEIEKLTGVSHSSISKFTKDMKNPAAAATTAGQESVTYEKLSDDIIASSYGNVKSHEEATETPQESEDNPDTKSYECSPETSSDEGTEGTAEKSVPPAVVEACLVRIDHLRSELDKEMVVVRTWEQEIKELREFLKLEGSE